MMNFEERAAQWDADPMKVERALTVAQAMRAAGPICNSMAMPASR